MIGEIHVRTRHLLQRGGANLRDLQYTASAGEMRESTAMDFESVTGSFLCHADIDFSTESLATKVPQRCPSSMRA
jgi:hypothetical protein